MEARGNPYQSPGVQKKLKHILTTTHSQVERFCNLVKKVARDGEDGNQWSTYFTGQITELYHGLTQEIAHHQYQRPEEIERLLQRLATLYEEWNIKMSVHSFKRSNFSQELRFIRESIAVSRSAAQKIPISDNLPGVSKNADEYNKE